MTSGTQKLSVAEKVGYSLGDGAANFVFMTMILFQLNFYTDTMGIAAGIAGTLLLVGRFWDAFFDPMMGVMADRTNTRWGKFRPWVLWTALPLAVVIVLAYTVPGFSYGPTLVYAAVTNILLMTLYSANNTPYSAMTAVMTGDVNERTSLSAYRFVAATDRAVDRGRLHAAAGGQVRTRQQRQGLADDHRLVGVDLRRLLRDHVLVHSRAHPAFGAGEGLHQTILRHSGQDRAMDRHVHRHPGPLHGELHARRHGHLLLPVLREQGPPVRVPAERGPALRR